ncbi:syncollin [Aquarana catesbeiana]|uniref:syncollin n=1 Tax=Aquarana catesbeiana TaxID=8400 RepID=UPI003CCA0E7F
MKCLSVYILPVLVALSLAACPLPAEVKDDEGNKLCARLYTDSSAYYEDCCAGDYLDVKPGEDVPYIAPWFNNRISSLVVATRCELTVWSKKPKDGVTKKFNNGSYPRLEEVKKGLLGNWNDSISSYYCKCN